MEKLAMRIRVGILSFVLAPAFCVRFVAMSRLTARPRSILVIDGFTW